MVQKGDIIIFDDKHRLMCGDSTVEKDVVKLMDGKKADMMITDPPYGVNYDGIINDEPDKLEYIISSAFMNAKKIIKSGGAIYIFHSDKMSHIFQNTFRKHFTYSSNLIWEKDVVLSFADYNNMHEPIIYGWNGGTHKFYGDQKNHSIFRYKRENIGFHTTPKPVPLYNKFIKNSSLIYSYILDLFAGSGTCLISCHETKRIAYLMEIDINYCEKIIRRYYDYTLTNNIKIIRDNQIIEFEQIKNELKLLSGANKKGFIDDTIQRLF